jgi:hypothetical protein
LRLKRCIQFFVLITFYSNLLISFVAFLLTIKFHESFFIEREYQTFYSILSGFSTGIAHKFFSLIFSFFLTNSRWDIFLLFI